MKILVASCDKDVDIFYAFYHCMEKYWPNHPEIIYSTETVVNPYYKTICKNYDLNHGTKRIRETLAEIEDDHILFMIDDCFLREKPDESRLYLLDKSFAKNTACFNLEKSFDSTDIITDIQDIKLRNKGSEYELSIMCGLGDREKFIDILANDSDPGSVEYKQDTKGYDYYINSGEFIINGGYYYMKHSGLKLSKWCRECKEFFIKEGITIDYSIRGFYD